MGVEDEGRVSTRPALFISIAVAALIAAGLTAATPAAPARAGGLEVDPVIGGTPMRCYDFRGVLVRTVRETQLGDVGRAWIVVRMPVIALDDERMATLPPKLQLFFYGHECAHHVLGHLFNPTPSSEQEADCWAIKFERDKGLLTRADVESFAPFLAASNGSPFGHLPGPKRQALLLKCFDDHATEQAAVHN